MSVKLKRLRLICVPNLYVNATLVKVKLSLHNLVPKSKMTILGQIYCGENLILQLSARHL